MYRIMWDPPVGKTVTIQAATYSTSMGYSTYANAKVAVARRVVEYPDRDWYIVEEVAVFKKDTPPVLEIQIARMKDRAE